MLSAQTFVQNGPGTFSSQKENIDEMILTFLSTDDEDVFLFFFFFCRTAGGLARARGS